MAEPELYLFTGPEAGEKNDAISHLKDVARKKHGDLDEYAYYAGDIRVADVVAQLQNESLFSAALFVTLRSAEQVKLKTDVDAIAQWAKAAAGSPNTLVLVSDETAVDKKLEGAVPASHRKIFWEMFENRKPQWVHDFFRRNGYSADEDAVEAILEMVENNTQALKAECSRFFWCFDKGHRVTAQDVDKILSHDREENAFTLFAAMANPSASPAERLESAMGIVQKIRLSRESNAVSLIAGLTYCFRQLRSWHALHARGASPAESQLKAAGLGGKKNQSRYAAASRVWNPGQTASVIALLSGTDMAIREAGSLLEDTRLFMLVYAIVIKNGAYCATYDRQPD